jgi:hypothetical protein
MPRSHKVLKTGPSLPTGLCQTESLMLLVLESQSPKP